MLRAMLSKELRETMWIALLGVLVQMYFVVGLMDVDLMTLRARGRGGVPFVTDNFLASFVMVAAVVAAVLGFRQTVTESARGTWLFLLQRPAERWHLLAMKMLAGAMLYLVVSAIPVWIYAWWAATPGTHVGPFEWSMTLQSWQCWISVTGVYFGAFLSGLRPARWFGTRLAPLIGAGLLLGLAQIVPYWWTLGLGAVLLIDAWLVATILAVARTRDYS